MKSLFFEFFDNLGKVFVWPNFFWHILVIVLTYFSVMTGFDWYYFDVTRGISWSWLWIPAGVLGGLFPIILPLLLYVLGKFYNKLRILNTSFAIGQAVILGWLVSSMYKAFTGRIPPDLYNVLIDISHGFRFGFWEGGILWGWPSSHTTIAFAMAVTLLILYFHNKKIRYIGLIYALYIGFGASLGFHWFSEVISGVIIGVVIGVVVGRSFHHRFFIESTKQKSYP